MHEVIHLRDNDYEGVLLEKEYIPDILQIANIGSLQNAPDLLVFPHSFEDIKDSVGCLSILNLRDCQYSERELISAKAHTGNLMGFVGLNDTSVSIHSRFTHKKQNEKIDETSQDFFLYYMLQKVFSINIFDLDHANSREDKIFDFLLFLFPMMLNKALSQGLFKEYQTRDYDDTKVRGVININRFIRYDIPFKGTVSYSVRERCFDNSITQLIRHTIEYIKQHPFGLNILNNDSETIENVNQIVQATPTYNKQNRFRILNANRRPKVHPYFTKYRDLQKLCVHILRNEALKYGKEKDKIHGVLFDGAWLWEEFLNTFLKKIGFKHAENKTQRNGIRMFKIANANKEILGNDRRLYPDFYKKDFIIDAKYKHLDKNIGKEDLYQVVTYMHCEKATNGGYMYPKEEQIEPSKLKLMGYNGYIYLLPFYVPQSSKDYKSFINDIQESVNDVSGKIKDIQSDSDQTTSPTPPTT